MGTTRRSIHFVGASRGIEAELVPAAGFDITLLPGRGVQRRLTWDNVGAVLGLAARRGAGGRAGASPSSGGGARARRLRLGRGRRSPRCCGGCRWWSPTRTPGPAPPTGSSPASPPPAPCRSPRPTCPVRSSPATRCARRSWRSRADRDRDGARRELGLPLDRIAARRVRRLAGRPAAQPGGRGCRRGPGPTATTWPIYHVVGARDWDARARRSHPTRLDYRPVRYESRMQLALAAADLVVCRSGGTTVAELAVIGVPSILVPLPIATRDHQTANAGPLVRAGAAVLVPDDELDADRLVAEVDAIARRRARRGWPAMADAARSLGRPDAARRGRRPGRVRPPGRAAATGEPRCRRTRRASADLDLSRPRRVHVVAVGGAGMSAIATVLVEQGHRVSGSDQVDGAALERLRGARRRRPRRPRRRSRRRRGDGRRVHGRARRTTSRSSRRGSGASRCCAASTCCPRSPPRSRSCRSRAPTARPPPPRCWPRRSSPPGRIRRT